MDLLEWVFQKVTDRKQIMNKKKIDKFSINLEDELISINLLISFIFSGSSQPIYAGKGIGKANINSIFLPKKIDFFNNSLIKNRNILLHKALVAGIVSSKRICYSSNNLNYAQRTLEIVLNQNTIISELEKIFPTFSQFSLTIMQDLSEINLNKTVEETEFKKLNELKTAQPFFRWRHFPELSLAPWVELLDWSLENTQALSSDMLSETMDEKNKNKGTELEGMNSTESIVEISLNKLKKEQNPVMHSFEKLETADEYSGGSRITDAEDDLEDHSKALSELNLKHVTREGGGAGSIFKSQLTALFEKNVLSLPKPRHKVYTNTSEWNYKQKKISKDYCRLYLLDEDFNNYNEELGLKYKKQLNEKYYEEIQSWKNRISFIVNQRGLKHRQVDGPEWNIDDYTRYLVDIKSCGNGDSKIFTQKLLQNRSFTITILMDVSLSTDSWVANQRVLDIQLDSVALCGLLLQDLDDSISIYSTWSETRHHCYLQTVKKSSSKWDTFFYQAKNIAPRGYTRLGPAIREISSQLKKSDAKKKLMIIITDGKPTDLDHYEGKYGIEDMKQAILEAYQIGVQVQALAIDQEAKFYFPQIFCRQNYQILSDPKKLPEQLFKIYFDSVF